MKRLLSRAHARMLIRCFVAFIFLLPFIWILAAAIHPQGNPLPQSLNLLPTKITNRNFIRVWELIPIGRFMLNSMLVSTIAVPLTIIVASWAGFSMAQLPLLSQRRWVILSLAVLMIPGIALWPTRFLIYKELGWLDSILALIAPAWMGTSPFYVLMFYRSFRRIPSAIYDAARLDGTGVWRSWTLVALPMVRPTMIGVALLSFVVYWGDFMTPLLYLRTQDKYTLPIALQLLQQMSRSDWPLLMAATTLATAVPVLLFLLLQPYFTRLD